MPYTNWDARKLSAWAVVYITDESTNVPVPVPVPVTKFSVNFALNSIPRMDVQAVLGREVRTLLKMPIHDVMARLVSSTPIELWVRVLLGPNSYGIEYERVPADAFRLFTGFVVNPEFTRSRQAASLRIQALGWPVSFTRSTGLVGRAVPLAPQQLSMRAAFRDGRNGEPVYDPLTAAEPYLNARIIGEDYWGKGVLPWLDYIASQEIVTDPDDPDLIERDPSNVAMREALNRLEPWVYRAVPQVDPEDEGRYEYGVPVPLSLFETDAQVAAVGPDVAAKLFTGLANGIAQDVAHETFSPTNGSDLWPKIYSALTGRYNLWMVPLANSGLIVPMVPGYRQPWRVIYGQEYTRLYDSKESARPVRSLHLLNPTASDAQASGLAPGGGRKVRTNGRFENPDNTVGARVYEYAPAWAANLHATAQRAAESARPFDVNATAAFPGRPSGVLESSVLAPEAAEFAAINFYDRLARTAYVGNTLRGRYLELEGKLRFDIGPGSTVEVRVVDDKFVREQTAELYRNVLFAEVSAVTVFMDRENNEAGTNLRLMFARNAKENLQEGTSVDRHPYWGHSWNGSPLVEASEFHYWLAYLHPVFETAENRDAFRAYYEQELHNPESLLPPSFRRRIQENLTWLQEIFNDG